MEKEIRSIQGNVEVREEMEGEKTFPLIEGYAIAFDAETIIGEGSWGWIEKVDRNALEGCDMGDVIAKFNHDPNYPLARTGSVNNLSLTIDNYGLKYSFRAMNEDGEKCAENIRLGIVRGSSFEFSPKETTWTENYKTIDGNTYELRTIKRIAKLYDVAPVLNPAYTQTTAELKSRCKIVKPEEKNPTMTELRLKTIKSK